MFSTRSTSSIPYGICVIAKAGTLASSLGSIDLAVIITELSPIAISPYAVVSKYILLPSVPNAITFEPNGIGMAEVAVSMQLKVKFPVACSPSWRPFGSLSTTRSSKSSPSAVNIEMLLVSASILSYIRLI